jgi:hypothetical protein
MDYLVFYRVLESTHARWGHQWSHRYDVVSLSEPISCTEDVTAIQNHLAKEHPGKRLELTSVMPTTQNSVSREYISRTNTRSPL